MRLLVALAISVSLAVALTGSGPVFPYGDNNGLPEPPCEHTTKIFFASVYTSPTGGLVARVNLTAAVNDGSACRLTKDVNNLQTGTTYYYVVEANAQNPDGTYRQTNCWGCGATPQTDTRQDTCDGVPVCTFKLTSSNTITIDFYAVVTNNSNFRAAATEIALSGQRIYAAGANSGVSLGGSGSPYIYNHKAWDDSTNNWDHGSGANPVALGWSWGYSGSNKQWAAVDTTGNGGTPNAFKVVYPQGTSSPAASSASSYYPSGIQFYERFYELQSYSTVRLTYEVSFGNSGFSWTKGGKLPGLYGGVQSSSANPPYGQGCSGGYDGPGCFSCRLMWREGGAGEAYIYYDRDSLIQDPDLFKVDPKSLENKKDGDSIGRGSFNWPTGGSSDYGTVSMTLRLNDVVNGVPKANGHLNVTYNGSPVINFTKMKWRKTTAIKFTGIMFSTFFGGATLDWAPANADQYARFRNFKIEYGNPSVYIN